MTRGDTVTPLNYLAGGGIHVKQARGGTVPGDGLYHAHAGHPGSLVMVTDAAGNVKLRCTCDAWGDARSSQKTVL